MQRTVAALVATLLTSATASAQSYPGDPGTGTQRGIAQVNNSGQVGTITLFRTGRSTRIQVALEGDGLRHIGGVFEVHRARSEEDTDAGIGALYHRPSWAATKRRSELMLESRLQPVGSELNGFPQFKWTTSHCGSLELPM